MFALTATLQQKFGIQLMWNFFATSHGKGPNDALGGNAKRMVHRKVLSRQVCVTDASSYATTSTSTDTVIRVKVMNSTDILGVGQELNLSELWDTVPCSVSGIRNPHCVIPLTNGAIRMMYYTDADHGSEKKICEAEAMVSTQSVVLLSEENTGAIAQANDTEMSSMPVQHDVATLASTSTATSASVLNCGSYQAGTITMARKQKANKATSTQAVYPCGSCQVNYGDPSDPKIAEEWIWCKKGCKIWFHQTCAEDYGVFDNADDFTCLKCLWLDVWLMWTWYRNAVDAGKIHILISTVSTLYFAFLYIKGVMIKWWFWSHVFMNR